jgi:hypothetical protein
MGEKERTKGVENKIKALLGTCNATTCWATMPCGALDACGIGSTTLCGNNPRSFVRNTVPIK